MAESREQLREKLFDTLKRKQKSIDRYDARIAEIRRQMIENCEHEEVREYRWEWDSGYGRQEWQTGHECRICGKKNSWPGMSRNWT